MELQRAVEQLAGLRDPLLPSVVELPLNVLPNDAQPACCSFCGNPQSAERRLFTGPIAQICEVCVRSATGLLAK